MAFIKVKAGDGRCCKEGAGGGPAAGFLESVRAEIRLIKESACSDMTESWG